MKTGLVYHPDYLKHLTGPGHPESPERLEFLIYNLEKSKIWKELKILVPYVAALEWVEKIHDRTYIQEVEQISANGTSNLDADTIVSPDTYQVALLAVGGVLKAIDTVMKKEVKNAFCAVRPPGHHAERGQGKGFCIFNNVAIGTKYIQEKYKLPKVLIVDWDVHHGNGTQNSFYSDPSVYYFSVHQYPFYPGTGAELEEGDEQGFGLTMNVPMVAGSGDVEYLEVFENFFYPVAEKFAPNFILVSAGFDAHKDDPLAGIELEAQSFQKMTQIVVELAEECCEGRLISVLEGGYNKKALAQSVEAHLLGLMGRGKVKRKKKQ